MVVEQVPRHEPRPEEPKAHAPWVRIGGHARERLRKSILYIVLGTNCLQQIDSNLWIEDFQRMEKLLRCVHSPATMDVLLTRYMKHMIEKVITQRILFYRNSIDVGFHFGLTGKKFCEHLLSGIELLRRWRWKRSANWSAN